jgi:hypothetical protein
MGWRAAGRIKKVTVVPRKEAEAEGTAGMDDRRNDGRGAWMASEGAGHGSGPMAIRFESTANAVEAIEVESPVIERCPKPRTERSDAQRPQRRRAAEGRSRREA